MEFEIEQDKLNIIKQNIESNNRFQDNKDLYEKFLNEVVKRGFIIFKTMDINNPATKIYINKIVGSSIVAVLEQENRLNNTAFTENIADKNSQEITNNSDIEKSIKLDNQKDETDEKSLENISIKLKEENSFNETKEEKVINHYSDVKVNFDFDYTPVIQGSKIKQESLQKLYDAIIVSNTQNPQKEYLQIYNLRYVQKLSIEKISRKLKIKEKDISKSLYELMEKVKETLE